MENQSLKLSVGEFLALTNQVLEGAYPGVEIEGEVSSFKVNQGKFVFFDLKDDEGTLGCFMMVYALRIPIEDGMKVVVRGIPKLTKWGRFSITVSQIRPVGEGSLKKGIALLREKLTKEGLFDDTRKRQLPVMPQRIAVVSSTQAAGYADFMKIVDQRWGGMQIDVAHVQVQGEGAADQIISAIEYINASPELPEVVVIIRGGGSADDLASFNDELLVRAVAASRVPILTGIGHEVDESLVDLAADVRASTPSNAAELLVPEASDVRQGVGGSLRRVVASMELSVTALEHEQMLLYRRIIDEISRGVDDADRNLEYLQGVLEAFHPQRVLERGYAVLRGEIKVGSRLEIETSKEIIQTEVKNVSEK